MLRRIVFALAGLLLVGTLHTHAAEYGVGVRLGTHGVGAEGAVGLTQWFTLRGGVYTGDVSESFEEGGIDYDGDLTVGGYGLIADFFPMRGGFRLSAGLLSNDNEVEIVATPTEPQEIGGMLYTPGQIGTLTGEVTFDDSGPYVGIGWGNLARGRRVGFVFDLGALYQGAGDVELASDSGLVSQMDLDAEEAEIEDDISDAEWWPVIAVGVAFRF